MTPRQYEMERVSAIIIMAVAVSGCTSPEVSRTRGGGPGADLGNRSSIVRMHEGANPFENTPKLTPTKSPPLEPARQADHLSRK
jgi:hypothetical protein